MTSTAEQIVAIARKELQECFDPQATNPRAIARGVENLARAIALEEIIAYGVKLEALFEDLASRLQTKEPEQASPTESNNA
jgi:hypothetical protein